VSATAPAPPDRILDIAYAFRRARLLAVAVELGIFTVLGAAGPLHAAALGGRCGLHPRGTRDALDALVALGLLVRDGEGRYANGPQAARWLDDASPDCIAGLVRMADGNERETRSRLAEGLRTGERQLAAAAPGAGFAARRCRVPRPCWTGGMWPCASSTRCRRPAASARARPRLTSPRMRPAPRSVRSGAYGTAAGRALYVREVVRRLEMISHFQRGGTEG
jgi:hypothetical protein